MKKEKNMGFVYFLAFTFLALLIFSAFGFYNNRITGSATYASSLFDSVGFLSEAIKGVMRLLFEGLIGPVFGYAISDQAAAGFVLRAMIFVLLIVILNSVVSKNENFKKHSWVISGVLAFGGAAFFPSTVLKEAQALIGAIVMIGIIVGSLIAVHKWQLPAGWKAFVFFIVLFLILTFNGLIGDKISDFGGSFGLGFYQIVSVFSIAISLFASGFYLIKAVTNIKEDFGGGPQIRFGGRRDKRDNSELGERVSSNIRRERYGYIQSLVKGLKDNTKDITSIMNFLLESKDVDEIYDQLKNLQVILIKEVKDVSSSSDSIRESSDRSLLDDLRRANLAITKKVNSYLNKNELKKMMDDEKIREEINNLFNTYINERDVLIRSLS